MRLEINVRENKDDDTGIVRGPCVCDRSGYQTTDPVPASITTKPSIS
jgi:hypothetical protein